VAESQASGGALGPMSEKQLKYLLITRVLLGLVVLGGGGGAVGTGHGCCAVGGGCAGDGNSGWGRGTGAFAPVRGGRV